VDHFNMLNSNRTFLQRYLREDSNFTKNGPIFAFTGAEGGDVPRFYTAYNTPIGLARRLGGMIIFMEMRFYGTSDTFNDTATECRGDVEELCPSANRLGLLSIEQGRAYRRSPRPRLALTAACRSHHVHVFVCLACARVLVLRAPSRKLSPGRLHSAAI
jgi:hypothetical protein